MDSGHLTPDKPDLLDTLAHWLATGFGAGLLPIAPGTFGSVEGVVVFFAFARVMHGLDFAVGGQIALFAAINAAVFLIGVEASNRVCRMLRQKDPGRVVIDEVSGQMISLTPILLAVSWPRVLIGFVLFRLFDIFKPYPIRKLERLPAGLGVMADDLLAGIYAAALLWAGCHWHVI